MDLTKNNTCIISAGIGGWYGTGIERLERSLNFVGSPIQPILWKDEYPPNCHQHNDVPYYFKIAAFEHAIKMGKSVILWVDASFWAVKNPMQIFDIINDQGYYMFSSGYSLGETVNDKTLEALQLDRENLFDVTEWASGCVGLNLNNPNGENIYKLWKENMDKGYSIGSRNHDNQSSHPRFRFHRQDQSCLSLAMHTLGLRNERGLDHVAYHGTNFDPLDLIFFIQGVS